MSEPVSAMTKLWESLPQLLSMLVSIFAVVTFVKQGTKSKIEQATAMTSLAKSVTELAKSVQELRTEFHNETESIRDELESSQEDSKHEVEKVWDTVKGLQTKQTTLCALHSVNHPGQAVGG